MKCACRDKIVAFTAVTVILMRPESPKRLWSEASKGSW